MIDVPSIRNLHFDADEIERRKQLVRDLWAGKPLDCVPIYINVENPNPRYTTRQQFLDADKQWAESLAILKFTWEHVPRTILCRRCGRTWAARRWLPPSARNYSGATTPIRPAV